LSHIITRDFFPNLPQIHATNDYLTALTNNDPELLSASIRKLSALSQKKEGKGNKDDDGRSARQAEMDNFGTPYISKPGGSSRPARTPLGARGWDTPADIERKDDFDELEGEYGELAGPLRPRQRKKQKVQSKPVVRDDLSLDTFQRNYTSEDNASFVQIVQEDNKRRREEKWGWAFEAERKAEQRKLEGEERRKMILDTALSGQWRVDANGKRLIGGLAEGGRDRADGEAWQSERKLIAGPEGSTASITAGTSENNNTSSTALVPHTSSGSTGQLVLAADAKRPAESVTEQALPDEHPLNKALVAAGLPGTALVSIEDGQIVPHREVVGGEGEGRGRGQLERLKRMEIEKAVLGDDRPEHLSLAGSGGDLWNFKVSPFLNPITNLLLMSRLETTTTLPQMPIPIHTLD
jgi:protein DGCR14